MIATERAFAKTMADRDLKGFASFIADEAIFFSGSTPLRGKASVVKAWAGYYDVPMRIHLRHPTLADQTAFLASVKASQTLHRPWVNPPATPQQFRGYVGRMQEPANVASLALVKSCGFSREGYSPRYLKIGGRWRDHERWAILAS